MSALRFSKPILVLDFESTGFVFADNGDVVDAGEPTQLGAVLLDPVTLHQTDEYLSDIQTDPNFLTEWVLENTDITPERVQSAPACEVVAREFIKTFGHDVFLASWNVYYDRKWLSQLLGSIGRNHTLYDYHHIDVWTLAYTYLAQQGKADIVRSEAVFADFGQAARSAHNALDDAKRTAAVMREILLKG